MYSIDGIPKLNGAMKYIYFVLLIVCFSCGKEKTIQLPEISNSEIQNLNDVSPAYIFYEESEKDSVELNRKNLINTTHWLVNVDKRLKLRQAIPSILTLQNKKRNAKMHKNEEAKNYYTCNDRSINNLGFIDFTEVIYHNGVEKNRVENNALLTFLPSDESKHIVSILFKRHDSITINSAHTTKSEFVNRLQVMDSIQNKIKGIVYLKFNENLTFQEYITYKSMLSNIKLKHSTISNDEYIFN
jgi:biopolymer transport protein ExbD